MYRCPVCGKMCRTIYGLIRHMRTHIDVIYPESRFCPVCGYISMDLEKHCLLLADECGDIIHAIMYIAMKPRGRGRGQPSKTRRRISKMIREVIR